MAANAFGIDHAPISKRDYSATTRKKLAAKGQADPDGSFPIKTKADLKHAKELEHFSKHPAQTEKTIEHAEDRLGVAKAFTVEKAAAQPVRAIKVGMRATKVGVKAVKRAQGVPLANKLGLHTGIALGHATTVGGTAMAGAGAAAGYAAGRKVSKAGGWKTIDQRERAQRRNTKRARTAASAGSLSAAVGGSMLVDSGVRREAAHVLRSGKSGFGARRKVNAQMREIGLPKVRGHLGSDVMNAGRAMKATKHTGAGKFALAAMGGGAATIAAANGAREAANGYHQHKINERRRAIASRGIAKAFTEPTALAKSFGLGGLGRAIDMGADVARATKTLPKAAMAGTSALGTAVSGVGRGVVTGAIKDAKAGTGSMTGATSIPNRIKAGMGLRKVGQTVAAHPGKTLGAVGLTSAGGAAGTMMAGRRQKQL